MIPEMAPASMSLTLRVSFLGHMDNLAQRAAPWM